MDDCSHRAYLKKGLFKWPTLRGRGQYLANSVINQVGLFFVERDDEPERRDKYFALVAAMREGQVA